MKVRSHSVKLRKIFRSRKLNGNRRAVIALIFFSEVDISRESTRCSSRITDGKFRKDFSSDSEARFLRSS